VGAYQSSDGKEIDGTLKVVEDGAAIDPKTFKLRGADADAGQVAAPAAAAPVNATPVNAVAKAAPATASTQQATSPARKDEAA